MLPLRNEYYDPQKQSATKHIKRAIISLATFGPGNTYVKPNQDALDIFEGFQLILSKILPPKIGFKKLIIEIPEVILETNSGNFPIDAASGGIASIIELAWMIYMFAPSEKEFTVLFIVATHNPFIVSSVESSAIYVLNYNENSKVVSSLLENVSKAGTSNEILREVLGITSSFLLWALSKIDTLIRNTVSKGISEESLSEFREQMEKLGFGNVIPNAINQLFEGGRNDKN